MACTCIRCWHCNGSGQVTVDTGSYPEEICDECEGTGKCYQCEECGMRQDFDED